MVLRECLMALTLFSKEYEAKMDVFQHQDLEQMTLLLKKYAAKIDVFKDYSLEQSVVKCSQIETH